MSTVVVLALIPWVLSALAPGVAVRCVNVTINLILVSIVAVIAALIVVSSAFFDCFLGSFLCYLEDCCESPPCLQSNS